MWPGSPPGTKTASIRGSFWKTSAHSASAGSTVRGRRSPRPSPDTRSRRRGRSRRRSGHPGHHLQRRQAESAGCRRRRRSGAGSARWRWCRRRPGRGCIAPTAQVPGVVGVGLGPIAELMAAEGIPGGGRQVEIVRQVQRGRDPGAAREAAGRRRRARRARRCRRRPRPGPFRPAALVWMRNPSFAVPGVNAGSRSRNSRGNESRRRAGPTAITGTSWVGQRSETFHSSRERSRTSSTSSRAALFSGPESPSGTTTTALLRSITFATTSAGWPSDPARPRRQTSSPWGMIER